MKFHETIVHELDSFLKKEEQRFPLDECLKIDLHCHDQNSDKPDEVMGRILDIPETWLPTEKLLSILKKNGCTAYTVTNHNNARSCYELQDAGHDILVGAEFSVTIPDINSKIHVLAYGFKPSQEEKLNKLRSNLYKFQSYALEQNIPTVWAHPLFHYKKKGLPGLDLFHKLSLIFQRFETMNGQRDTWQNMLVKEWVSTLTPEVIDANAKKFGIKPTEFLEDPYSKFLCGGSDEHMGIFTGQTGTYLHVPNLQDCLQNSSRAELALEAIRNGRMAPFGNHHDSEKMTMAFIDYFCQIGINLKDPGLMRILFHKGETRDKLLALLITNGFLELGRHRLTTSFIKTFHNCFLGENPGILKKMLIPKKYRPIFKEAEKISETHKLLAEKQPLQYKEAIEQMFEHLTDLIVVRLNKNSKALSLHPDIEIGKAIQELDIPSHVRLLFESDSAKTKKLSTLKSTQNEKTKEKKKKKKNKKDAFRLSDYLDGLSFPVLASTVITAATFTSAKVLYNTRPLLEHFSEYLGKFEHPKRMLWLTDTFEDKNGVSIVLHSILAEIRRRDLPIDMLVCSDTLKSEKNLIVIPSKFVFSLPFYKEQPIRIPNILELHQLFKDNEYDRIMCSTEGFMGLAALFLKQAYTVPAYFYIHTDWVMFGNKVLKLETDALDRVRRILRAAYKQFDKLFVLNSDQRKWLQSRQMGISPERIKLTAHWADSFYKEKRSRKKKLFGVSEKSPVLLFTGRISKEKGATEIPAVYKSLKKQVPDITVVFAGTGPAEEELKEKLPDAVFLGWVDHEKLPQVYSSADLLILPSVFDTFGCVVLEALSCATPVLAYKTKGPKDIITHEKSGYLASNKKELHKYALHYFTHPEKWEKLKKGARKRASEYSAEAIMDALLADIGLT